MTIIAEHAQRIRHVEEAVSKQTGLLRVPFRREHINLKSGLIRHDYLLFRLDNGRTMGEQLQIIAERNLSPQFFMDHAVAEAQDLQEQILAAMADENQLMDVIAREGQTEQLLVTEDAIVINGNRRLACMRRLAKEGRPITRWPYIEIAVLPSQSTDADILDIEAALQIHPDVKAAYRWYDEALLYRHLLRHKGESLGSIAERYGKKPQDIQDLLNMIDLAQELLTSIGKPNAFKDLDKQKYAFDELQKIMHGDKKEQDVARMELVKLLTFKHMQKPANHGRRYSTVPLIHKHLQPIVNRIDREVSLRGATTPDAQPNSFLNRLVGDRPQVKVLRALTSNTLDTTVIAGLIDEEIAEQERLAQDKQRQGQFQGSLDLARSSLVSARTHLGNPDTSIGPATIVQLDELQTMIADLRTAVAARIPVG